MTDEPLIGPIHAPQLHVMSFNIRRRMEAFGTRRVDRWEGRAPLVSRVLQAERPGILSAQELLPDQALVVAEALGSHYEGLGHGRNPDRDGERVMLFVDRRRFAVTQWRQIALSDTPDVAGSRSWGNRIPRTAVLAHLTDAATHRDLLVVATHLDHISRRSRLLSARLLARLVAESGRPAIVMGDANTAEGTHPYRALLDDGDLVDTWDAARERESRAWGTFSNYRPPRAGGRRIDWILASRNGFRVDRAAINPVRFDGRAPSDHEPVQAVLSFGHA